MKTERSCSLSSSLSVSLNSSIHQESDEDNSFKDTQQKPVKQKKTTKSKIYYFNPNSTMPKKSENLSLFFWL
jgi:hypothetical protein